MRHIFSNICQEEFPIIVLIFCSVISNQCIWAQYNLTISKSFVISSDDGSMWFKIYWTTNYAWAHQNLSCGFGRTLYHSLPYKPSQHISTDVALHNVVASDYLDPNSFGVELTYDSTTATQWYTTFGPVLPFDNYNTFLSCRTWNLVNTGAVLSDRIEFHIPNTMESFNLVSYHPNDPTVFSPISYTLTLLLNSGNIPKNAYLNIEFDPQEILGYNICNTYSVTIQNGNLNHHEESCLNNVIRLYPGSTSHYIDKNIELYISGIKNPPTNAQEYYGTRISAYSDNYGARSAHFLERTAAFYTNAVEIILNSSQVSLTISNYDFDQLATYSFTLTLPPPELMVNDRIRIEFPPEYNSQIYELDTEHSSEYIVYHAQEPFRVRLIQDNKIDFTIVLYNVKNPLAVLAPIEIQTFRLIRDKVCFIHRTDQLHSLLPTIAPTLGPESGIYPIASIEAGDSSAYRFVLKPNRIFLGAFTPYDVLIKPHPEMGIDSCKSTSADTVCVCAILDSVQIMNCSISANYDYNLPDNQIEFNATSFRNPKYNYLLSEMIFEITIFDPNSNTKVTGTLPINSTSSYQPKELLIISANQSRHESYANGSFSFGFKNQSGEIPELTTIKLKINYHFGYADDRGPLLVPSGIYPGAHIYNNTSDKSIFLTEVFSGYIDGHADSQMSFNITNIINPFATTLQRFEIWILKNEYEEGASHVAYLDKYITINGPGPLELSEVIPHSLVTSTNTFYLYQGQTKYGPVNKTDYIRASLPPIISKCTLATFTYLEGFGDYPIPYRTDKGRILLEMNTTIPPHTLFRFKLRCRSPETTQPQTEFVSLSISTKADLVYYEGKAAFQMTTPNNFSNLEIDLQSKYNSITQSINFRIVRTGGSTTKLSKINVNLNSEITITDTYTVDNIQNITFHSNSTNNVLRSGQIISIYSISYIDHSFGFVINGLRNPSYKTDIIINVTTYRLFNSTDYISETNHRIHNILCDFPCRECMSNFPTICTSCFSFDSEVFHSANNLPQYLLYKEQCIPQCPSQTYQSIARCFECDSRCNECQGPSNNECDNCQGFSVVRDETETEILTCICANEYFFYPEPAIDPDTKPTCQTCHVDCKNCTSPSVFDCDVCNLPIMHFNTTTSTCDCPKGMYKVQGICFQCPIRCLECDNLEECLIDKCNNVESYYALYSDLRNCIRSCVHSELNLFLDISDNICKLCHNNCFQCLGSLNTQCNLCTPPYHLHDKHNCQEINCNNYYNTFPSNYTCEKCDSSCDGCRDFPNFCLSCAPNYLFLSLANSCLLTCPIKYYDNHIIHHCQICPEPCLKCKMIDNAKLYDVSYTNFNCSACENGDFLNTMNKCVTAAKCGKNYYLEEETRLCTLCNQACLECYGPNNYNCFFCREKFVLSALGICEFPKCNLYQYLDENLDCINCNSKCMRCIGPNYNNCLSCQEGLIPKYVDSEQVSCVPCENVTGYFSDLNQITKRKHCSEICGDGLNLGRYKCDDGNRVDGDGCSSKCEIEEGFACSGGNYISPDHCKNILPPKLLLTQLNTQIMTNSINNKTKIIFHIHVNKPVRKLSEKDSDYISMSISGGLSPYIFDEFISFKKVTNADTTRELEETNLDQINYYDRIIIEIIPKSSIAQNDLLSIFIKSDYLQDINQNIVLGVTLSVQFERFAYYDPYDKEVVKSSGNTIFYSMLGLLSLNILIAIVCSSSMSFLFPLFNMIQLIVLLPLLEINLPENFKSFINNYLQFANFKFDFLFNPFHRWKIIDLSEVNINPLNDNFERNNLQSKALIVNYGGQLIIWTILNFFYVPIYICAKCCGCKKFKELKSAYEYAILLTSFSEAFVEFALLSFLNIYQLEFTSFATGISTCFGITGMFITFGFIALVLNIISNISGQLNRTKIKQKFGCLYADTNYNNEEKKHLLPQFYHLVFLGRRFLYILVILGIYKIPILQQVCNISIHALTFLYDIKLRPYEANILGLLIYCFDFIVLVIFATLPLYMVYPNKAEIIGKVHIYILIATIALSWIIIISINIRVIYNKFKKKSKKKKMVRIYVTKRRNSNTTGKLGIISSKKKSSMQGRRTQNMKKRPVIIRKKKGVRLVNMQDLNLS